jgi:hypothetical protein
LIQRAGVDDGRRLGFTAKDDQQVADH